MKQITTARTLNEEEYEFFKKIYHLYTIKELSEMFGITQKRVKSYLIELGAFQEEVIPEGMKKCTRCNEILPLDFFQNKAERKDGKSSYCRTCIILMRKELEDKKRQEVIEKKIQQYKEKHKNKKLFCKKCNKEKTFDDYRMGYHFRDGRLNIYKKCKECESREAKQRNINKIKNNGFYF